MNLPIHPNDVIDDVSSSNCEDYAKYRLYVVILGEFERGGAAACWADNPVAGLWRCHSSLQKKMQLPPTGYRVDSFVRVLRREDEHKNAVDAKELVYPEPQVLIVPVVTGPQGKDETTLMEFLADTPKLTKSELRAREADMGWLR